MPWFRRCPYVKQRRIYPRTLKSSYSLQRWLDYPRSCWIKTIIENYTTQLLWSVAWAACQHRQLTHSLDISAVWMLMILWPIEILPTSNGHPLATFWPPQFDWISFKTWGGQGGDLPHWPPLGHLCFSVLATPWPPLGIVYLKSWFACRFDHGKPSYATHW